MMVTVESTGTLERRMRVELPAERIEKEVESRLKSVGRTAKIKGFRPGKIPAKVVRQRYGTQVRQEVLSDLMGQSYRDAVAQENLNPVAQPKIEPEIVLQFHTAPQIGAGLTGVLNAIGWVAHGFEIVQSHFPGWKFLIFTQLFRVILSG